jgi:hypothetical protein
MTTPANVEAIHAHLTTIQAAITANQWDSPYEQVLDAIVALRKETCATDGSLEQVLTTIRQWEGAPGGGYALLVDVARSCPVKDMVFNALWILTNVASDASGNCRALVNLGVIPLFIEKLSDENMDVVEQAGWVLGNLAGDCVEFRDMVHNAGGVAAAVDALRNPLLPANGRRNITWTMSNLCRGKPPPRAEQVAGLMEYFTEVLTKLISAREAGDVDIEEEVEKETIDILWGISYVTNGDNTQVQIGIDVLPLIVDVMSVPRAMEAPGYGDAPVVERLVPCEQMAYAMEYLPRADLERLCMLNSDIWNCCVCANRRLYSRVRSTVCHTREVRVPAVRIIGNVMTGNNEQRQAAIDCGALRVIESVSASLSPLDGTDDNSSSTMSAANEWKEVCWILSNVTAGTPDQSRLVLRSSVFYNLVLDALRMTGAPLVRKEAAWVVGNALVCIPDEVPLAWIAALFGYFGGNTPGPQGAERMLEEAIKVVMELRPELPRSLSVIEAYVTEGSTPENLLLLADTFARDDCAGSTTDRLTPLMRDHVLPALHAAGKLQDNEAFVVDEEEGGDDGEVAGDEVVVDMVGGIDTP